MKFKNRLNESFVVDIRIMAAFVGTQWNLLECSKYCLDWASLVAQWLRICLPMQGTRVRALVWEDPTCRGAIRPVSHNY